MLSAHDNVFTKATSSPLSNSCPVIIYIICVNLGPIVRSLVINSYEFVALVFLFAIRLADRTQGKIFVEILWQYFSLEFEIVSEHSSTNSAPVWQSCHNENLEFGFLDQVGSVVSFPDCTGFPHWGFHPTSTEFNFFFSSY